MIPYEELCAALERHRRAAAGEAVEAPIASAPVYDPQQPAALDDGAQAAGGVPDNTGEIDLDSDVVDEG